MRAAVTPLTGHRGKRPSQTPWQPPLRRFVRALKDMHTHIHTQYTQANAFMKRLSKPVTVVPLKLKLNNLSDFVLKLFFVQPQMLLVCRLDRNPQPPLQNETTNTHTSHRRITIHMVGFNLVSNACGVCYNGWLTLSLTLRE